MMLSIPVGYHANFRPPGGDSKRSQGFVSFLFVCLFTMDPGSYKGIQRNFSLPGEIS